MSERWLRSDVPRGRDYDRRWVELERAGQSIHGEADFVASLQVGGGEVRSVLDAGCGTGRVGIELARRGLDVVGVDLDPTMLDAARQKAPDLLWHEADLATVTLARTFDVVAAAGNVMIFLEPGTEAAVVANLAAHLAPGGLLVAGFQLKPDRLHTNRYDELAADAGLTLADRFATWQRAPWGREDDYAVSVHRRIQ